MTLRERMTQLTDQLNATASKLDRNVCFMEVCGTHTVNACRSGIHSLMPDNIRLVSGPGCPVCVTAQRYIDALIDLGNHDDITLATYGDMMRVTGSGGSLELARSRGADVQVITSTMEAIELAQARPDRQVVFAAVGFETTAPATAASVLTANKLGLANYTVLPCHKLVIPAMKTLLDDPDIMVDGFLCPGHVSVIIGAGTYRGIVDLYRKPCVISGFESLQIMEGVMRLTKQIAAGESRLENLYPEVVHEKGNPNAWALIEKVFVPGDATWRALGIMPESGLDLRPEFAQFDAFQRFDLQLGEDHEPAGCRCGEVITGRAAPSDCALFATVCSPINPIGPCMVSSEGSCQAWFKYRRQEMKKDLINSPVQEVTA